MQIKGYNIKEPETVNQTTIKKIIQNNLNFKHIYKYSTSNKNITIWQQINQDNQIRYIEKYNITNPNYNQYYNICSYLEQKHITQIEQPTYKQKAYKPRNNNNKNNNNNNNNKTSICNTITILTIIIIIFILLLRII